MERENINSKIIAYSKTKSQQVEVSPAVTFDEAAPCGDLFHIA